MDEALVGLTNYYYYLTILGETGVDLFFVLSGFLITGILIDTANNKNNLKNFYIRRSLRIFPLYYLILLIFLLYFWIVQGINNVDVPNFLTHLFYLQNWSLEHNQDQFILLEHTWSLAVEEQFYLFWPLLFLWLYEKGSAPKNAIYLCLYMIFISWGLRLFFMEFNQHKFAYTFTISRLDGLALGALLSITCVHYKDLLLKYKSFIPVLIGFLFLVLMLVLFGNTISKGAHHEMTRVGLMICTTLYTFILALVIFSDDLSLVRRILESRWLMAVGKYSYGMYIFHSPAMMVIAQQLYFYNLGYWTSHLALLFSGTIISFILAFGTYHALEKHMINLKKKYAPLVN